MDKRLRELEKKRNELEKRIEVAERYKQNVIDEVQSVLFLLREREINHEQYYEKLAELFGEKTAKEWVDYYDEYISSCKKHLDVCEKKIKGEKGRKLAVKTVQIVIVFSFFVILFLAAFYSDLGGITGFVTFDGNETNVTIPKNVTNVTDTVSEINETDVTVELPIIVSENLLQQDELRVSSGARKKSLGKRIVVSGPDGQINVPVSVALPAEVREGDEKRVKVYWIEEDAFLGDSQFNLLDPDDDNVYDFIEIIVPHFSNQIFDIIIEITEAEHLDSDRNFISDIYEEVKELDDIWSETIPNQHYVRVTFEQNLTSSNDITLYPRTVSGNPRIEIYEKDGEEIIAEFESLNDNEYNKVFLDNLVGSQDTFDLRIVGGSLEFDHIIDPPGIITDDLEFPCASATNCDPGSQEISTEMRVSIIYTLTANDDQIGFDAVLEFGAGGGVGVNGAGTAILNAVGDCSGDTDGWYYTSTTPTAVCTGGSATCVWNDATNLIEWDDAAAVVGETLNATWYVAPCSGADASANDPSDIDTTCSKDGGTARIDCDAYLDEIEIDPASGDSDPPLVTINQPANTTYNLSSAILFNVTTNEASSANYTLDGGINNITMTDSGDGQDFNFSNSSIADGTYTANYHVRDTAGNLNATESVVFSVDQTAPLVSMVVPSNASNFTATTTDVNFTMSDSGVGLDTCWYTNSSGTYNYSFTCGTNLTTQGWDENTNIVVVYSNDTLGNENSSSVTFLADTIDPTVSYGSATQVDGINFTADYIYVNVSVTETNFKNITFILINDTAVINKTTFVTQTFDINWTSVAAGNYSYNVSVFDDAQRFSTTEYRRINLTSANSAPTISFVSITSAVTLTEGPAVTEINLNFTADDADGVTNLDSATASANFTLTGEATRSNSTCAQVATWSTSANYTCNVTVFWFDGDGSWNVNATINDLSSNVAENNTQNVTLNSLTGLVSSPASLTFATVSAGGKNETSTNDPISINNTGNKNITAGNLVMNATNLVGETTSTLALYSGNFSLFTSTGSDVECAGSFMNDTGLFNDISGATLPDGNFTVNDGSTGQEQLYVCLTLVGSELSNQAYSTSTDGPWTIQIT